MKKHTTTLFACAFGIGLSFCCGCVQYDELNLVKANMSERSDVYFFSDNPDLQVSLCSGEREEPYAYDGYSCNKLGFALLTAQLGSCDTEIAYITIDGREQEVLFEFNYVTSNHVADLEQRLTGNERIYIKHGEKSANLACKSVDFGVSADEAISLGVETMMEFIAPLCDQNNFLGECYLKILDSLSGGFVDVFWLFSVLDQNGHIENIVISTNQPIVLAGAVENVI